MKNHLLTARCADAFVVAVFTSGVFSVESSQATNPIAAKAPLGMNTYTPIGSEWDLLALATPAEKFETTVFEKLKVGDVEWLVGHSDPQAYQHIEKDTLRKIYSRLIIPYFSDFAKPVYNLTVSLAKCENRRGFSFYDFFYSTSGQRKPYMIEVSTNSAGEHLIHCVTMKTSFSDEYPRGNERIVVLRRKNGSEIMREQRM